MGRLSVKRKLCRQGFARKTCGFFRNEDADPFPNELVHLDKTRPFLFREVVFPPAAG